MKLTDLFNKKMGYYFREAGLNLRLTIGLFFLCIGLSLQVVAQQKTLSVSKKNVAISQIIAELEKSSRYVFFFSEGVKPELNRKVSLRMVDKPINEILDGLFRPTNLSYTISGRQVTIHFKTTEKPQQSSKKRVRVSGKTTDSDSKESLANVNIYIKELRTGTSTNEQGEFTLTIPPGNYTLHLSYIGYTTSTEKISLTKEGRFEFQLHPDTRLDEVLVLGTKKDENITRTTMGMEKMSISEIKRMPALMGEVDVIKAIQQLPGVQPTSEGGSGYSVRGGSVDQNLVLLDNATVYNASHMFGFFSVFNNDVVERVDLYKGDLPLKFAGRLSSLLDVQLKETYTDRIKGSGGIGLISSRLMLEGALGKRTNWLVGGRRSYADLFLKASSKEDLKNSVLYFYDLNGKITHRFSDKDRISLNLYSGGDKFGASSVASFSYGNYLASLTWGHLFNEHLLFKMNFNTTNYHYGLHSKMESAKMKWEADITDYTFRWDWTHIVGARFQLNYGLNSTWHKFNPGVISRPSYSNFTIPKNNTLEHGTYLSAEHQVSDKLTLRYGLRLAVFQNIGQSTLYTFDKNHEAIDSTTYRSGKIYHTEYALEPRVALVYKLSDYSSIKMNYARNTQFMQLANNSSSGSPLDLWFPASPNIKPQKSDMVSAGYFQNFKQNAYETSVEVYYKKMNHVIDFADHAQLLLNKRLEGEIRTGKGQAYGIELMVKKNTGRLTGFVNYTLSRSERTIPEINGGKTFLSPFDKTHSVNILASYKISSKWDISAAWIYATGNPTSYPTGRFEIEGEYFPIYSGRNEYRKKDYHRLDLSATYVPTQKKNRKWKGEWNFSLYNAYGQKNPWLISYDQNTANGIPNAQMTYLFSFVPSVTYNFKF